MCFTVSFSLSFIFLWVCSVSIGFSSLFRACTYYVCLMSVSFSSVFQTLNPSCVCLLLVFRLIVSLYACLVSVSLSPVSLSCLCKSVSLSPVSVSISYLCKLDHLRQIVFLWPTAWTSVLCLLVFRLFVSM